MSVLRLPGISTGAPSAGELITRPVVILALVVLAVNDHWLKAHWSGLVTGKLSDVAGLVLLPCLVVASVELVQRRVLSLRASVAITLAVGFGFAVTKTWAPAAELYRASWGWLTHPLDVLSLLAGQLGHDGGSATLPGHRVSFARDASDLLALPGLLVPLLLAGRRHGAGKRMPMACGHTPSARGTPEG